MQRWMTVKRIHQAVLERDAAGRAAFLEEACAGDEALRREVESLLAFQDAADSFMESPALEVVARSVTEDDSVRGRVRRRFSRRSRRPDLHEGGSRPNSARARSLQVHVAEAGPQG